MTILVVTVALALFVGLWCGLRYLGVARPLAMAIALSAAVAVLVNST